MLSTKATNAGKDTHWIWCAFRIEFFRFNFPLLTFRLTLFQKSSIFNINSNLFLMVRNQLLNKKINNSFQQLSIGKYGSYNKITKQWDGLVKHLLDRVRNFCLLVKHLSKKSWEIDQKGTRCKNLIYQIGFVPKTFWLLNPRSVN